MHQSTGSMHTWRKRVLLNHGPARGACTGSMLSKNRPQRLAGLLYLWLILIVYYKNLQKFCKQRGGTNKFDLYIDKLG